MRLSLRSNNEEQDKYKIIEYFLGMYNIYLNIIDEINDVPIISINNNIYQ